MSRQRCMSVAATGMAVAIVVCRSTFAKATADTGVALDDVIRIETGGNNGSEFSVKSTQYVWYEKKENGKTYRRLYDATHGKWVTDWILYRNG